MKIYAKLNCFLLLSTYLGKKPNFTKVTKEEPLDQEYEDETEFLTNLNKRIGKATKLVVNYEKAGEAYQVIGIP